MKNQSNVIPFQINRQNKRPVRKNYKNEIESVFNKQNVGVGFRVRRDVLFGFSMEIDNYWCATKSLTNPDWKHYFRTRKEAREHLEGLSEQK